MPSRRVRRQFPPQPSNAVAATANLEVVVSFDRDVNGRSISCGHHLPQVAFHALALPQRPAVVGQVRMEDKRRANFDASGNDFGGLQPDDGLENGFCCRVSWRGVADRGVAGVGACPHGSGARYLK